MGTHPLPGKLHEWKDLKIQSDGSFRADMARFLKSKPGQCTLVLQHPLYTEGQGAIDLGDGIFDRLKTGESLTSRVEIAMAPQAILRGKVELPERAEEEAEEVKEAVGAWSLSFLPPGEEGQQEQAAKTNLLQGQLNELSGRLLSIEAEATSGGAFVVLDVGHWTTDRVALYEVSGTRSIHRVNLEPDGTFELTSKVGGELVLVAISKEGFVTSQTVFLELAEEQELEGPVVFESGAPLGGFVEDFGLYPDGGLDVVARRKRGKNAVTLRNQDVPLIWEGKRLVRESQVAKTDANGAFSFEALARGDYTVAFEPSDADRIFSTMGMEGAEAETSTPDLQIRLSLPVSVVEFGRPEQAEGEGKAIQYQVETRMDRSGEFQSNLVMALYPGQSQSLMCLPKTEFRIRRMLPEEGQEKGREIWSGFAGGVGSRTRASLGE